MTTNTAPRPYADWFQALLDREERCEDTSQFEHDAYQGYVCAGLADTDGHYAPMTLDHWVINFRRDPIASLYFNNDARHKLAPQALSYCYAL